MLVWEGSWTMFLHPTEQGSSSGLRCEVNGTFFALWTSRLVGSILAHNSECRLVQSSITGSLLMDPGSWDFSF